MRNTHWDYADSFSGRDAAYLIAGLDPSSNSAEEAYRSQPIIRKLKKAYYAACSDITKSLRGDHEVEGYWRWLLRYKKLPEQLLSVEMDCMISNFISSEYVREKLNAIEASESITSESFHKHAETRAALATCMQLNQKIIFCLCPNNRVGYERYNEISKELERLKGLHFEHKIFFNEYYNQKIILEEEYSALWDIARKLHGESNTEESELYTKILLELDELTAEESDWNDQRSAEQHKLIEDAERCYMLATSESRSWLGAESHEFDDQKFSREELSRWIVENSLPSEYQFPPLKVNTSLIANTSEWGSHSTYLLSKLSKASMKFWNNYDAGDATTAPTNETVIAWLVEEGVSKRIAEAMASILRADGLPTGRRN